VPFELKSRSKQTQSSHNTLKAMVYIFILGKNFKIRPVVQVLETLGEASCSTIFFISQFEDIGKKFLAYFS